MVNVKSVAPTVVVQMKYATDDNFLGVAFYTDPVCYLTPATALKVAQAESVVASQDRHLVLYDCARPVEYQYTMWNSCVVNYGESHCSGLVANPYVSKSGHTYGKVIDVGLVDSQGITIEMPSKYDSGLFPDDTSTDKARSRPSQNGIKPSLWSETGWQNYLILSSALRSADFVGNPSEWWHWKLSNHNL